MPKQEKKEEIFDIDIIEKIQLAIDIMDMNYQRFKEYIGIYLAISSILLILSLSPWGENAQCTLWFFGIIISAMGFLSARRQIGEIKYWYGKIRKMESSPLFGEPKLFFELNEKSKEKEVLGGWGQFSDSKDIISALPVIFISLFYILLLKRSDGYAWVAIILSAVILSLKALWPFMQEFLPTREREDPFYGKKEE
ncbi:MAG: hypothetical protein JRI44_08385 [Deltaproteobacteria bacterium]|nr:hypothetical protein [Deltaproteobacteria bacterium]